METLGRSRDPIITLIKGFWRFWVHVLDLDARRTLEEGLLSFSEGL